MTDETPPPMFVIETTSNGRVLVVCNVGGARGASRVSSRGLDAAKAEAEAQARAKLAQGLLDD